MTTTQDTRIDETGFWKKLKNVAKFLGEGLIGKLLMLYYCWCDPRTPFWAKAVIAGAIAYFISPVDAIPDFIPGVGYLDDAGVIASAIGTLGAHITDEHQEQAKQKTREWFD